MGLVLSRNAGEKPVFPYLQLVLIFNTLVFFWGKYLDYRQLQVGLTTLLVLTSCPLLKLFEMRNFPLVV